MEHLPSRTERRIRRALIVLAVVALSLLVVLYLLPDLRLRLGHRLGIVPGAGVEHVAGPGEAQLIVVSTPVATEFAGVRYRHEARYLFYPTSPARLTDLRDGRTVALPVEGTPRVQISPDRARLLFQAGAAGAIVDLTSGEVSPVDGEPPGEWGDDVYTREDRCSGASPRDRWTLCLAFGRGNSRFLFGDWELRVRPYGTGGDWTRLYRGRGLLPIVGFAPDERSVYLYNEHGIWRAPIDEQASRSTGRTDITA